MLLVILRRLRDLVIVLLVVGTSLFFLLRAIPGDPARVLLGEKATAQQVANLRHELGLSGPIYEQYLHWLKNMITGDFGTSITFQVPVLRMLVTHIGPTVTLALASTVISFVLTALIIT